MNTTSGTGGSPECMVALADLNAEYWERVDLVSDEPVDPLYVDQGVLEIGRMLLEGRGAIRDFFVERNRQQQEQGRLTRHVHSNLRCISRDGDQAVTRSLITVYAGIGDLPVAIEAPSTVADVLDVCECDEAGIWRFVKRTLTPIFVGPGAAAFVRN